MSHVNYSPRLWMAGAALMLALAGCQPIQPETGASAAPAAVTPTPEPVAAGSDNAAGAAAAPGMVDVAWLGDVPVVTVTVGADSIAALDDLPSGPTAFVFAGEADPESPPDIGRLVEGATVDQLSEALGKMADQGPGPALELVKIFGSGGSGGPVVYDLTAGSYLAAIVPESGTAKLSPTFAVSAEANGAAAPEAAVKVELQDFAFTMPDSVAAGPQVWEISNVGKQWHEMAILKLNEGVTVEDLFAFIQSAGPDDMPPFEPVGFYAPISEGNRAWTMFDLPAGEYTVICFLPDLLSDMSPHAAHGMVRTLTVE